MKKAATILYLFVLVMCISACNNDRSVPSSTASEAETISSLPSESISKEAYTVHEDTSRLVLIESAIDEAIGIMNTVRQDNLPKTTSAFHKAFEYDTLSSEEKALYDEMLPKIQDFEPFSYLADEVGYEVLDRIFGIFGPLSRDYPELGIYFTIIEVFDDNVTTALEARYFLPWDPEQQPASLEALQKETELFAQASDRIVERMPEGLSAYDQYRYLATVVSLITDYDHSFQNGWQLGSAYGAIVGGSSICQGYSYGFMYLCQKANLWCATVEGIANDNFSHMWNMIQLDSAYYHVDVTWSDELGDPTSEEWLQYFVLTDDEISVDHVIT